MMCIHMSLVVGLGVFPWFQQVTLYHMPGGLQVSCVDVAAVAGKHQHLEPNEYARRLSRCYSRELGKYTVFV